MMNKSKGTQKDMDMDTMDTKLCPKHGIPLVSYKPGGSYEKEIWDEDGNLIGIEEIEIELEECLECDAERENKRLEELSEMYYNSQSPEEEMKIIKEETEIIRSDTKKHDDLTNRMNLYDKYIPLLQEITNEDVRMCKSTIQFGISCAMYNMKYANNKGDILPNIALVDIAHTSSGKSQEFDFMHDRIIPKLIPYPEYLQFERGGARAIIKALNDFRKPKKDDDEVISLMRKRMRIPASIMQDDMDITSDANSKGMSDIYTNLSKMFGGRVDSNNTTLRGYEKGNYVYTPMWLSGTPASLMDIKQKDLEQGFWFRCFFLPPHRQTMPEPVDDEYMDSISVLTNDLINDLNQIKKYRVAKTTPEFKERWNEFWMEVKREEQEAWNRSDSILDEFELKCTGKVPVSLMKLAMINAMARWNIEDGILVMDTPDIESAIEDWKYYTQNMVETFDIWLKRISTKEVDERIAKFMNTYQRLRKREETFRIDSIKVDADKTDLEDKYKTGNSKTEKIWIFNAISDPKGEWVRHSDVTPYLKKLDKVDVERLVETLVDKGIITSREANLRLKSGSGNTLTTFYKVNDK